MDIKQIKQAQDLVGQLADMAMRLPADTRSGGDMALHLRVAQLFLAEFAGHLAGGMNDYEALIATAKPAESARR